MTLNFIHSDKYADAIKVASKFTETNNHRPILLFVNHRTDGMIEATDSKAFIQIKNIHGFDKNYLVHPKTLEFATGNYPNLDKSIGEYGDDTVITLNKKQISIWLQLHRSINQLSKSFDPFNRTVHMDINKQISLSIGDVNAVDIDLPSEAIGGKGVFNYNVEFMRNCLEVHQVLGTNELQINVRGKYQPVVLCDTKRDVVCGFSPIRTYKD